MATLAKLASQSTLTKRARKAVLEGEKSVKLSVAKAGKTVRKSVAKAEKSAASLVTRVSDKVTGRDKRKKAIKRVAAGAAVAATLAVAGAILKGRAKKH